MSREIYQSKYWKQIRLSYALSKHCICERCGRPVYVDGITDYLPKDRRLRYVVHHKTYISDDNITDDDIVYNTDNLELLCIDCHNTEHKAEGSTKKGLMFDTMGNLVQTPQVVKRKM